MKRALIVAAAAVMVVGSVQAETLEGQFFCGIHAAGNPSSFLVQGLPGLPTGSDFGYAFAGPTTVTAFSLGAQIQDYDARVPFDSFYVYANGQRVGKIELNPNLFYMDGNMFNSPPQPNLPILSLETGLPIAVTATWFSLVPARPNGTSNIGNIVAHGTPYTGDSPEIDLNYRYASSFASVTGTTPHEDGKDFSFAVNGNLNSSVLLWNWDPNKTEADSLTVTYKTAQEIGSIGIALAGSHEENRRAPKWVEITATDSNNVETTQRFDVDDLVTFYNRFNVSFSDVMSLTITFPKADAATTADDWYYPVGTSTKYGLTAFQAFATPFDDPIVTPIPEPATMSLLTLGGLALLRRRK